MERHQFLVTFFGPFRSATGKAGRGFDVTVDAGNLLPGSHMKGLMRNAACQVLGHDHALIEAVFGSPSNPSPWHWGSVAFNDDHETSGRTRTQIDPDTHTVVAEALVRAEEVWATTAEFEVEQMSYVSSDHIEDHKAVLLASAAMVHAVGGDRRRGFGWVGIQPQDVGTSMERFKELACANA